MSLQLLYINSKVNCYQPLQNIPAKEEVNLSGSSNHVAYNSNVTDTVAKPKLPEGSRCGSSGFPCQILGFSYWKCIVIYVNPKPGCQPTSRLYGQHWHTHWDSSTICSHLSHLRSISLLYPCCVFLPVAWGEKQIDLIVSLTLLQERQIFK